jgi:DNA-binding NarL/FixJ family response regulator
MRIERASSSNGISVLLADSKQLESQLLAGSLRHHGFQVFSCRSEVPPILEFLDGGGADVVVISCVAHYSAAPDVAMVRTLHLMHPQVPKICLIDNESRQATVQAFRSGARGLFCLGILFSTLFCECIRQVHLEIFATNRAQLSARLVCPVAWPARSGCNREILLTSRESRWSRW